MKRLGGVLLVIALVLSACGGRNPEPATGGDGLAALDEQAPSGDSATKGGDADAGSKAEKEKQKASGGKKQRAGGGATNPGAADDGESDAPDASSDGAQDKKPAPRQAQAAPAAPVPAGTLSYDTDGTQSVSGNQRRMPRTTTLTARAPRGDEQTQIRDLRDSDGNGTVVETRLLYRPDGVYITYVKITATFSGGFTDVRELRPPKPALIAPTGAKPGATASFSMEGSGTRADVDVAAKRFEDVTIGDSTVRALVVDTKIVFSGAIEGRQTSTSWFWGKHVLSVREAVATDVSNGPIRVQSQYQAVLTRLP
jgi:hypothetical protein